MRVLANMGAKCAEKVWVCLVAGKICLFLKIKQLFDDDRDTTALKERNKAGFTFTLAASA